MKNLEKLIQKKKTHTLRRLKERFEVEVSNEELCKLNEEINSGIYELSHFDKDRFGIFKIRKWECEFYAVFQYNLNTVVTVLELDMDLQDFSL